MRYYMTFEFTETETQAQELVTHYQKTATPYARKNHPAHYTPWEASDGKGNAHFVVLSYYRR